MQCWALPILKKRYVQMFVLYITTWFMIIRGNITQNCWKNNFYL